MSANGVLKFIHRETKILEKVPFVSDAAKFIAKKPYFIPIAAAGTATISTLMPFNPFNWLILLIVVIVSIVSRKKQPVAQRKSFALTLIKNIAITMPFLFLWYFSISSLFFTTFAIAGDTRLD